MELQAALFILFWLACAAFSAGIANAYFCREYPSVNTRGMARDTLAYAWGSSLIIAPVTAVTYVFLSGFLRHGWSLRLGAGVEFVP